MKTKSNKQTTTQKPIKQTAKTKTQKQPQTNKQKTIVKTRKT